MISKKIKEKIYKFQQQKEKRSKFCMNRIYSSNNIFNTTITYPYYLNYSEVFNDVKFFNDDKFEIKANHLRLK